MEPDLLMLIPVLTLVFWVIGGVLALCLALAPLFIWKWAKATAHAVEENNRLLRILVARMERRETGVSSEADGRS